MHNHVPLLVFYQEMMQKQYIVGVVSYGIQSFVGSDPL